MKLRLLAVLLSASWAAADEIPGTLHELLDETSSSFERLEASGVTYVAGRLVVVDDTLNSLFVFDPSGRLLARTESARFPTKQAKFEDVAFHRASETFFAVGAHSGWDSDSLEQLSVLYEFRLSEAFAIDESTVRPLALHRVFEKLGLWKPRGMKIEGLAIDDRGETLYVGLREPVDRARVYALSVAELRRGEATGSVVVEFEAGAVDGTPFCISALVWDSRHDGLFVTTSTEDDLTHRFLGNRLWFAAPGSEPVLVFDRFDDGMKAEGLALGAGRLFIVYDNDQDDTAIPSQLRVVPLEPIEAKLAVPGLRVAPDSP